VSRFGRAVDLVVQAASALRGERVIHAKGHAFSGQLTLLADASALDVPLTRGPRERPVLVRFSRGAGLPDALPDVLGIAIRVPDADGAGRPQDLMLSTGGGSPLLRRMLVPRWDYRTSTYTSLVSYEVGGRDLVVAALPEGDDFLLATAEGGSAWMPFGRLSVDEALPDEQSRQLSFSVTNDAGGFRIGGRWRAARAGAYAAARSVESP
jgi:hypothetical protein